MRSSINSYTNFSFLDLIGYPSACLSSSYHPSSLPIHPFLSAHFPSSISLGLLPLILFSLPPSIIFSLPTSLHPFLATKFPPSFSLRFPAFLHPLLIVFIPPSLSYTPSILFSLLSYLLSSELPLPPSSPSVCLSVCVWTVFFIPSPQSCIYR